VIEELNEHTLSAEYAMGRKRRNITLLIVAYDNSVTRGQGQHQCLNKPLNRFSDRSLYI